MSLLVLTLIFPLAGAIALSLFPRMADNAARTIGAASVGLAAVVTALVMVFWGANGGYPFVQTLWQWIAVGDFHVNFGLYLDGLSITMMGVITGVGFLIHLFAAWYMVHDLEGSPGMARFFAYMNLFIVAMLLLVLGDNLLLLYLGWEGVGLCSYLLIGYYYQTPANAWAAFKAFIITRIGDVFLAIGLFLLYTVFGTLNIQTLLHQAPQVWAQGDAMANVAALLILLGACGKSAQLPLQTWLADAMAGPTPVSALIHAATMVTAGVYLIARMHGIFEIAPAIQELVGVIGGVTLLIAGLAATAQTDIKRVIAYSTMSQIGYMFLALGVGAWQAAIFHLMIHAFFKSLLFLTAGSVIIACHHEQNIFKMGGLRKTLKLDYWLMIIGGSALSALPLVTAGFYSKDAILWDAVANGHGVLWLFGLIGAFITSIYTFRMIFIVFHGEEKTHAHAGHGIPHHVPLIILAVLSTFVGAMIHQPLDGVLPSGAVEGHFWIELVFEVISSVVALVGLGMAAALFLGKRQLIAQATQDGPGRNTWLFFNSALGFDWLYDKVFVQPFLFVARGHRRDWIETIVNVVPGLASAGNSGLSAVQSGRLRWYAMVMFAGAAVLLAVLMFG
ncbi:NADH-quinone oxidoreductase subunit L [Salinisphaera hydrothermalis]|uniref:NADH:ubiquinone oxidoreductase subunit L n=1 Tax=Salinisphaera hydrothermalis (strain C41B8) TaxID=1304275 RepID=A0A084IHH8_SALHC|nr:NADH-quinone oxidoreductase subunit L [Salinisphaera hydrothermalis]KEZ76162.1 NADH:ubiquinone oxidoreductase subunit L [Salinisphaera hydrothermalis C41B8]